MRPLPLPLLVLALAVHTVAPRLLHSLPEDTYAFPKYRVVFLNGLPVLNNTAENWLKDGLRGGQLEFLDQPWKDETSHSPSYPKEIGSGHGSDEVHVPQPISAVNYTLEHMKMGPKDSYICLIPKPLEVLPSPSDEVADSDVTPVRSWSLLQPLSGTCLYHRQGWFTYSYCHNEEIRQFKELIPQHSRTTGAYTPEEDPEWESYTLGRAPSIPEPGADLTIAEQNAQAANLELARHADSRYLVQRWGDGTHCDKTNKNREVEVQFHCSMVMTDNILFVKETKTCSYVVVIHTPRLCGEPGFKSRRDFGEETQIRCREVVDTQPEEQIHLPTADHPLKVPRRKTVLPAPVRPAKDDKAGSGSQESKEKIYTDLIRKTLEAMMAKSGTDGNIGSVLYEELGEDGELVIELADDDDGDLLEGQMESADRLVDALRAAGFDVKSEVIKTKKRDVGGSGKGKADERDGKKTRKSPPDYKDFRDEL